MNMSQSQMSTSCMSNRYLDLEHWLSKKFSEFKDLKALNNDASFRKYYRFKYDNRDYVAVDSPPDKENNAGFFAIQQILSEYHVNVPKVYIKDISAGFYVLEDLGNQLLLPLLKSTREPKQLYTACLNQLLKIQSCDISNLHQQNSYNYVIPKYDDKLLTYELGLFHEWFLQKYLGLELSSHQNKLLNSINERLIENAHDQPQVLVHRDFHSRNLLIKPNNEVAVIDFQDAVVGPATYDLVSLYRDCYIDWPQDTVEGWVYDYLELAQEMKLLSKGISKSQYWNWFLKMTLQRNFKTIGIFSRLYLRDNKHGYLNDIPRTLNYALDLSKSLASSDINLCNDSEIYKDIYNFLNTIVQDKLKQVRQ